MLPNGVDAPADEDLARGRFRHRLGLAADVPLIVFLGRLHPIKRLDLLAAAFVEVRARHRTARLVIAGPDEDGYRGRVEPLFAPVRDAVHWIGEVGEADKWALLADADALVMCSDSESFGLSVLEAMAAAVPVVATRTCPWEEVETAGCGFSVPHDAHALAGALGRLLGEPARARAMGQKGRALARAKYSWDSIAAAMAEHYEDVVARNKPLDERARSAAPAYAAGYPERALVVTPGVTGTDGIAFVSRLVVRALEPPSAGTAAPVEVLSVGDPPRPAPMTGALGQVALSGAAGRKLRFIALALRRALARPRPSNVVCLHLRLSPVARLVTGARGRLAVFLHGIEAWKPLGPLERWALGRADVLVANSEHTARRFRQANPGFSGRPIAVCHLGVGAADAARSASAAAHATSRARSPSSSGAWPARSDTRVMMCSSTSGRESGTRCPARASSWPETATTARASKRRPPRSAAAVRFLGRVSDQALDALYRDCAFFVMPSRDEGFGLVFLEAMRAGKACIGGAGAAAEVIEDGVTGLVVDATDSGRGRKGGRAALPRARDAGAHGTGGGRTPRLPVHRSALSPPLPRHPRARRAVTAVLGICAYHGDAAAALVVDGRLEAAVEEERFARVKHWAGFPRESIRSCLDMAGMTPADVDHFAIGRNPRVEPVAQGALRPRPSAEPRPRLGPRAERPPRAARGRGPRGRPRRRPRARRRAPALGRAPSGASRQRLSRLALRGGGRLRHRRLRRLRQHLVGHRPRGDRSMGSIASTSPTRSASSTSRSPSTWASRPTATSTR